MRWYLEKADSRHQRRLASSRLLPLIADNIAFLQSLVAPSSSTDDRTKETIRAYLASLELSDSIISDISSEAAVPSRHRVATAVGDGDSDEGGEGGEVDELLMQMSVGDDGQVSYRDEHANKQNGHFGMTSFLWQTPSASVLERLQRSETERLAVETSPSGAKADGEVWATDEIPSEHSKEAGLLRANASMLSNWENREDPSPLPLTSVAFHKLQLEYDDGTAKMIIHLLKVRCSATPG